MDAFRPCGSCTTCCMPMCGMGMPTGSMLMCRFAMRTNLAMRRMLSGFVVCAGFAVRV